MMTFTLILFCVVCIFSSFTRSQQYIDDPCTLKTTGENGQCQLLENCPRAVKELQSHIFPQTCGFQNEKPIVCCTEETSTSTAAATTVLPTTTTIKPVTSENTNKERKSAQKCREYAQPTLLPAFGSLYEDDCPYVADDLLMRNTARPREFPHMAAIAFVDNNGTKQWLCSGSLISDEFVLTAAHCLYIREYGEPKYIRLGDLDLNSDTDEAEPKEFSIVEIIPHPDFRPLSAYNDIGLLRMEWKPATFGPFIKPACLNTNSALTTRRAISTGWGSINYSQNKEKILLKTFETYSEYSACNRSYANQRRFRNGIDEESQICTESNNICQGESGRPLQIFNDNEVPCTYKIVGVNSFAPICYSTPVPGVYTRVSKYIDWIENTVWP